MIIQKKLLVIFPYQSVTGEIHPWIKNEVWVFKKIGYEINYLPLQLTNRFVLIAAFVIFFKLLLSPFLIAKSDIILIPTSYLMLFPIISAKILKKKVFISHLSTSANPSKNLRLPKPIKYLLKFSDKFSFKKADHIITFSTTIAKLISKQQEVKFNNSTFYYSEVIDPNLFKPNSILAKKFRKKLNLENKIVLFYHGKYHPFHGMEYFFEAFKTLFKTNNKLRLVILSFPKGQESKYVNQSITNHPGIIFVPQIKYEKLAEYLQVTDLWIGRFKYDEEGDTAFSTCAVEAMACGKPIITYNNIENSRVITDGLNGILVEGNNSDVIVKKIKPYITSKKSLAKLKIMGKQARKSAIEEFSNVNIIKWLMGINL